MAKAKKYKPSDMNVHVKQCVHETMRVENDKVIYEKFLFTPANYPCGGCNAPDDVVFMRTSPLNEVIRSCTYCGVTQPISARDANGLVRAQMFEEETHVMTVDEIKDFVARNKIKVQFLPSMILTMLESKRERRNVDISTLGLEEE